MIFTSINAATSTGPGVSHDMGQLVDEATMVVSVTGNPTLIEASIEVSLDGVIWVVGYGPFGPSPPPPAFIGSIVDETHLFRFIRGSIGRLEGGTAPTVTAKIAANVD